MKPSKFELEWYGQGSFKKRVLSGTETLFPFVFMLPKSNGRLYFDISGFLGDDYEAREIPMKEFYESH